MPVYAFHIPENAPSPRWANAEKTKINIQVFFPHLNETVDYTAAESDPGWDHSEHIFRKARDGDFGPVLPYQPPILPEKTKLYKADVWRRCTATEAELLDSALAVQPVRLRRMWDDALFISTADELYGVLLAGISAVLGATRAAELLEPTE